MLPYPFFPAAKSCSKSSGRCGATVTSAGAAGTVRHPRPGGDRSRSSAVPGFQRDGAQHFPALYCCSCSLIKISVLSSQTGLKSSPTHHAQTTWEAGFGMATPPMSLSKEVQQQLGRCWLVPVRTVYYGLKSIFLFFAGTCSRLF